MDTITRNIRDMQSEDRRALEHVVGQPLRDDQRVVIQITESENQSSPLSREERARQELEAWQHVYDGLSDEEIEELDRVINIRTRRNGSAP